MTKARGLSERTAPFDALVYICEGEAQVLISGEPHALNATQPFKMLLVMVRE